MYAGAHILLTYTPQRAAKAGTVCAFRELCVLAEGNCSNHTQIKTSQYREQGYLNAGTEGGRGLGSGEGARAHTHALDLQAFVQMRDFCRDAVMERCTENRHARIRTENHT